MSTINPPKALLFDVFGTLVDWRTTVSYTLSTQAALALNSPSSASLPPAVRLFASTISWPDFAQEWRDTYKSFTKSHSSPSSKSKYAFKTVDQHHYDSLVRLLADHNLTGLWSPDQLHSIARIWHFLDPWSDTSPALHDLSKSFVLCTLSNGNVSLLPFSPRLQRRGRTPRSPGRAVRAGSRASERPQSGEGVRVSDHLCGEGG
ncbi:MAG: hypothetical protein Q9225_006533 [Loekoesia sp. 1 TL-2023]